VTPTPVTEALLVVLAVLMGSWMLSYLAHSTLAIGAAALLTRLRSLAPIDQARAWRFAIVAPFLTATVHVTGLAGSPPLSWEVATHLPQALVDWRLGIVSVSLLTLAAAALTMGWIAGAVVLRRVLGRRRLAPASLQDELASLAVVMGCRVPRLTVSDTSNVPAAVGLSEVCVPGTSFGAMSPDERRTLLAHEVGHLVARDPLWFAVAGNLARLTAFQPLNRWAIARLRMASEEAADDFSVEATGDRFALARALVGLASMLWVLPGGAAANGSPIVARVGRLLDGTPAPAPSRRPVRQIAALVALAALLVAAPGFRVSVDDVASRLPWLAPGKEEPNARMLEVRQFERALRDALRDASR
jgi:Zn-dependent protease with chaperone function